MSYGAIISVDGRGAFTQHLPLKGEFAVPLVARDTLDFAYELDDAPHWERFYKIDLKRLGCVLRFFLNELNLQQTCRHLQFSLAHTSSFREVNKFV